MLAAVKIILKHRQLKTSHLSQSKTPAFQNNEFQFPLIL